MEEKEKRDNGELYDANYNKEIIKEMQKQKIYALGIII